MRGYKVKITLNGSKPPIWRSCILPEGLALRELPDVFARVMGWRNSEHDPVQPARFTFPDSNQTFESDGEEADGQAARWEEEDVGRQMFGVSVKVSKPRDLKPDEPLAGPLLAAAAAGGKVFSYTFLSGSTEWEHKVQVQKVVENGPGYPELQGHSGECPPANFEGGIFRYQSLSQKERKKAREGYFPYRSDMIQERLKNYYMVESAEKDKPKQIYKIKINEEEMEDTFRRWMKGRNSRPPEHYTFRDALETIRGEDLPHLLDLWDYAPEEYEGLDEAERRKLVADRYEEPGMLERYLRCISDVEWQSIKHAVEWETWRYYLLPGEDDFTRLWSEAFLFRTKYDEIETPDEVREIFPKLDADPFFQKRRREISWIRDCAEMAVQLYGFAPLSVVARLTQLKSGYGSTEAQVADALRELTPVQRVHGVDESTGDIYRRDLELKSVREYRQKLREDLDYMIPEADLIGANHGIFVFPGDRKAVESVQKHLDRWTDPQETQEILLQLLRALASRIPSEEEPMAMELFLRLNYPKLYEGKSKTDTDEFLRKVLRLGQNVRCWVLKGWTQVEVDKGIAKKRR